MADEDKLNFLEETSGAAPEPDEPEQIEAEPEDAEPETVEAEAADPDTGEDLEAPPASTEESRRDVPVTALLDEREKRQKLERELEELRRWKQQQEMQAHRTNQPKPDFFDDPEKAVSAHVTRTKLEQSRFFAEREYGAELVGEAFEYFNQHPQESQQLLNHSSPFHAAVEHYKRQKFLAEVQDPDQWREQERERLRQELLAQSPSSRPKAPPPSMSKAPSAGRDAITPGNAFDQMLPD